MIEVIAALAILALTSSSVLLVIDRCLNSASDSALRMEAFDLVRENLEKILALDSVAEGVDYGTSQKYPEMSWQTVIEGFPEPVTGQMWVRAVCTADYLDSKGEKQKIELVHWIAQLTDQQAGQLVGQQELEKLEVEQLMKTDEEAADYAKIDTDTLRKWIEEGLVRTADGAFIRHNLDLFIRSQGNPTAEEKAEQVESIQELAMKLRIQQKELENGTLGLGEKDGATGASKQKPEKLDPSQVIDLVNRRRQ